LQAIETKSSAADIRHRRVTIALYLVASFFFWGSQYIYLPTLPTYLQTKVNGLSLVGFVLSMYGLWQAIIRIPLGIACDWIGWRKPFIIGGLALGSLGAWMMATSDDLLGLALGRSITGLSTGTWVVLIVAFSALFPPTEAVRASALLTLFNTVGRIFTTSIAGSLNDLGGPTLPFFVATGIGLLSAIILVPIDEPRRSAKPPSMAGFGRLLARSDVMLPTLLSTVTQYALWSTSFGFLTVLAKQLGATNVLQSAVVSTHLVFVLLGNFIASSQAQRVGNQRIVYASFALLFVGMMIAALAPTLAVLFAAPVFIGLALGVGYPVTMGMSIERVEDAERTIAMGLHQAIYAIGMFVGPALSGVLADHIGLQPMFGGTAFVCLALGWIGARWIK
jgi:DHA1 family multidrug resistance protein-like MFS transporter